MYEFVSLLIKLIGLFPNPHFTEYFIDITFGQETYRFQRVFSYRQEIDLVILVNLTEQNSWLSKYIVINAGVG